MASELPLYAPAKNLSWILITLAAIIIIYIISVILRKYFKVKPKKVENKKLKTKKK